MAFKIEEYIASRGGSLDGTQDCTAAFLAACFDLATQGGGTIAIPDGVMRTDGKVEFAPFCNSPKAFGISRSLARRKRFTSTTRSCRARRRYPTASRTPPEPGYLLTGRPTIKGERIDADRITNGDSI